MTHMTMMTFEWQKKFGHISECQFREILKYWKFEKFKIKYIFKISNFRLIIFLISTILYFTYSHLEQELLIACTIMRDFNVAISMHLEAPIDSCVMAIDSVVSFHLFTNFIYIWRSYELRSLDYFGLCQIFKYRYDKNDLHFNLLKNKYWDINFI